MGMIIAQADPTTSAGLFWAFAILSGASALGVVVSRNIVRMAVFLLFTLAGVAGLYFLLSAEFLAAGQFVGYARRTLILIIFRVMLPNTSPFRPFASQPADILIALAIRAVAKWLPVFG